MQATATPRKPRPDSYRKVLDSRKRRVRGLWQRNGHFYANLILADDLGRKTSRSIPPAGATLDDPKADYARLLTLKNSVGPGRRFLFDLPHTDNAGRYVRTDKADGHKPLDMSVFSTLRPDLALSDSVNNSTGTCSALARS